MTLSGYFTSKSVFSQQGCRALTFALATRLACSITRHHIIFLARPSVRPAHV